MNKTWLLVAAMAMLFVSMCASGVAYAQQDGVRNHGHAENHDWYQELKQPGTGYSCCNGTTNGVEGDCRPSRVWSNGEGSYSAIINGKETPIPPRVILRKGDGTPIVAPDGHGHICASRSGVVYCGILSPPKS